MNRKPFVLALVCLIIFNLSFAQSSFRQYTNLINQAEILITEHNELLALSKYDSAFQIKTPFATDIYNAAACAIKQNDRKMALQYCMQLANKGVGRKFFTKRVFKPLQNANKWKDILKHADVAKDSFYNANKDLWTALNQLYQEDQDLANHRKNVMKKDNPISDSMLEQIDALSERLIKIYQTNQFPSEEKLGANIDQDTIINNFQPFNYIILHAFQMGSWQYNDTFGTIIKRALNDGLIPPVSNLKYLTMSIYFGMPSGESLLYCVSKCKLYEQKLTPLFISHVDNFRKGFYLSSLSDYKRKALFNIQYPSNPYFIPTSYYTKDFFISDLEKKEFNDNYIEMPLKLSKCN